jgi:glycosyltransferase involved in cell wall biosynthesis
MKYPYVIFYRLEQYSHIDNFFITNNAQLNCTIFFTSNVEDLNKLFNSSYQILITYGPSDTEYNNNCLSILPNRARDRWIHLTEQPTIDRFNYIVNYCFIHNCVVSREHVRPVFSAFSSTYNSYNKIFRAYNSLKKQTFKDWEWVILDDSPDDEHFKFLRENLINDNRVRLYRKGENSGNIGNVKNEAVSLCRGKYILELDHDDEILPDVLQDSVNLFDSNNEVGFIYMDCSCIYENGNNQWYGDFICKGYGNYYCQKYNNRWVYVYNTPNINNITLSHLVCCPNHPRIWRTEALIKAGNYSEFLPICDDYEIIIRTALTTKIAKIHKLGYIQYMNDSNNNFSLIRNEEINRIGPLFINPIFYEHFKIHEEMKKLDAYEDEAYVHNASQLWKRDLTTYTHKFCNLIVNPDFDKQYCIIGIDSLIFNLERIKELYKNPRNDFILLENKAPLSYLFNKLDNYGFERFKCYSLVDDATDTELTNYFVMLIRSCDDYEIINNNVKKINYNTDYHERFMVINSNTHQTNTYLEIGVETGFTFNNVHFLTENKTGVDPDPKCSYPNLIEKTSDSFFEDNKEHTKDVIFIDGMHQTEYILRDINNSIKILNAEGKIFIDDILPLTYDEQLKIPNRHYYENGILKYGEPWTGDVWKLLYFMLQNYYENFVFSYFYNVNYRGVGCIQIVHPFQIDNASIDEINNYNYFEDFNNYIDLILEFKNGKRELKFTPIKIEE